MFVNNWFLNVNLIKLLLLKIVAFHFDNIVTHNVFDLHYQVVLSSLVFAIRTLIIIPHPLYSYVLKLAGNRRYWLQDPIQSDSTIYFIHSLNIRLMNGFLSMYLASLCETSIQWMLNGGQSIVWHDDNQKLPGIRKWTTHLYNKLILNIVDEL